MKDLFSVQANDYARFRPQYPQALFDHIFSFVKGKTLAWDCGTGNGQTAVVLSRYFDHVMATDISRRQLLYATPVTNISYRVEPEGRTSIHDKSVDLVTASQALHWFDTEGFFEEVRRVSKPGAVLACWVYGLLRVDEHTDKHIDHLYNDVLGPFWDAERRHVDNGYADIPFPLDVFPDPGFTMEVEWTLVQLEGFLSTWSALQHYRLQSSDDPVRQTIRAISAHWPKDELRRVRFPLNLKLGIWPE